MGFTKRDLHVIAVVSNPVRYKSRYELFHKFADAILKQGANLYVVEAQNGERDHVIAQPYETKHTRLVTIDEIWHKENMINIGVSRLPPDWRYCAWVDSDILFENSEWIDSTLHALQSFEVVQLFQTAVDLAPDGSVIQLHNGFGWEHFKGNVPGTKYYPFMHPGYGWAYTRKAWNGFGGLIDRAVLGSGDHHMALGLIGKSYASLPNGVTSSYRKYIYDWQKRALESVKKDIGYVPGTIKHLWHGRKKTRFYQERWKILEKHKFCPFNDLKRDWQGLLQLEDHRIELRDDIRKYFHSRLEDSVDVE